MKKDFHMWVRGFKFAAEGARYALRTQINLRVHVAVSFFVLLFAALFRLQLSELLWVLLAVTLVIGSELINTAVEKAVDLSEPNRHPLAKAAKDTAAAAVLIAAVFAVVVGLAVFAEPLWEWMQTGRLERSANPLCIGIIVFYIVMFIWISVYSYGPDPDRKTK